MTILSGIAIVFLLLILIATTAVLFLRLYGTLLTPVPFVSVRSRALDPIVDALKLHPNAVLYDLGSGDGRVLERALQNTPSIRAVGIEIAPLPRIFSRIRLSRLPKGTAAEIRKQDFFKTDLRDATHIFMYLFPDMIAALESKLVAELAPGTRVVSCDFAFPDRVPDEEIVLEGIHPLAKRLFVYTF